MNAIEVITLNEAMEQVSGGQGNQALPKLFKLAAAYPQNKEIQAAIWEALNGPVPAAKATPTKPFTKPMTQVAPTKPVPAKSAAAPKAEKTSATTTKTDKTPSTGKGWYGLPFVGTLLTVGGAVLPWLNVSQGSSDANFNSLGGSLINGSSQDSLGAQVTALALGNLHGWMLFGLLGVLLLTTLVGLFARGKGPALVMLLISAGSLALLGWSYTEIKAAIEVLYSSSNPLAAQPGLGFWGSVAGIVINMVGTVVVLFRVNPAEKIEKRLKQLAA